MPWRLRLPLATVALLLAASALAPACKRDEPPGPPQKVELSTLQKDLKDDAKAADAKWKDKNVEVTGWVNKVRQDVDNHDWVVWVGSGSHLVLDALTCRFPAGDKKAPALEPKQRVTVHGRVGGISLGQIWMVDCHLDDAPGGDGGG
jgi:hypothetical protein